MRVHAFIDAHAGSANGNGTADRRLRPIQPRQPTRAARNFRFYDNRQKYLLFVTTCGEKWAIAQRVGMELATSIHVRRRCACSTPAWATAPCCRAPCAPCTTGFPPCRSTSSARRSASRTCAWFWKRCQTGSIEHPATVLVMTNLYYAEAPWLKPQFGDRRHQPGLARTGADRQHRARLRNADHRAEQLPQRALACPRRPQRQPGLRKARRAGDLS